MLAVLDFEKFCGSPSDPMCSDDETTNTHALFMSLPVPWLIVNVMPFDV